MRYYRDLFGVDNGLIINLECMPENVKSIITYMNFKDIGRFVDENEAKKIKNSVYQL